MTVIVGLVDSENVYIGGDSAGTSGHNLTIHKDPKVFRVGQFVIGCTGLFRVFQILQFHLSPPAEAACQTNYTYMVREFVPAVRQIMKEHGGMVQHQGHVERVDGACLVGLRGSLFRFSGELAVSEPEAGYMAEGDGERVALGSLHATEQTGGLSPKERIEMALTAAEAFTSTVRRPFTILSTR